VAGESYLCREIRSEPVCEMGLSGQGVEDGDADADEVANCFAHTGHGERCGAIFLKGILGIISTDGDFVNVSDEWGRKCGLVLMACLRHVTAIGKITVRASETSR
jgi:hypothetical protein